MNGTQKVGNVIFFEGEKRPYIIRACSNRYLICTTPFSLQHTVLYTIVDLDTSWRAPNDFVFNLYDYAVQSDIDKCLKDLEIGYCHLSKRHGVDLVITKIINKEVQK